MLMLSVSGWMQHCRLKKDSVEKQDYELLIFLENYSEITMPNNALFAQYRTV